MIKKFVQTSDYETSVQKWKYVFQRRIACERELGKEAFDCKEIMELLKVAGK